MKAAPLLVALGLALSGCGGDPEPAPLPVPSRSPSPSAAPAALPSPSATGVAGEVERGVLAYFAGINEMFRSGSTAPYRATFTPDCKGCLAFETSIGDLYAKGQRIDGAQDTLTSLRVVPGSSGTAGADARFDVTPYRVLDASGGVVDTYPASKGAITMQLFRQPDGRYLVVGIQNALPQ